MTIFKTLDENDELVSLAEQVSPVAERVNYNQVANLYNTLAAGRSMVLSFAKKHISIVASALIKRSLNRNVDFTIVGVTASNGTESLVIKRLTSSAAVNAPKVRTSRKAKSAPPIPADDAVADESAE